MTDRYSMQSSVVRHIYGPYIKCRTTKFLCIVEPMGFYGLPAYNGAGWLELRNYLIGLGGVGYGAGSNPLAGLN